MKEPGKIITFYSYKGGVGRTVALMNVAVLLAQRGSVLVVDFDLEAPGCDDYLRPFFAKHRKPAPGLLGLLESAATAADSKAVRDEWHNYTETVKLPKGGNIDFLGAGQHMKKYVERVQALDWNRFFREHEGGPFFEDLRESWAATYDYVLIDSRTGYTDLAGLCLKLLPDILALVFVPSEQSLAGAVEMARRARGGRRSLSVERSPLAVLPIPGRMDARQEKDMADRWRQRFAEEMKEFFYAWLPIKGIDGRPPIRPIDVIERIAVPYVAYYSYGEQLAALRDSVTNPESPAYAYEGVAQILERSFRDLEEVIQGRGKSDWIDPFRNRLNERQERIIQEVVDRGKVTSGWVQEELDIAKDTAVRDLAELVEMGALRKVGRGRATNYIRDHD